MKRIRLKIKPEAVVYDDVWKDVIGGDTPNVGSKTTERDMFSESNDIVTRVLRKKKVVMIVTSRDKK